MLHVSQWQELLSIVHRRHWVDQIATWPLFATLNAIQLRTLNDNLQYVQFPAGEKPNRHPEVHATVWTSWVGVGGEHLSPTCAAVHLQTDYKVHLPRMPRRFTILPWVSRCWAMA